MFSIAGLLSLPLVALARDQSTNDSSVANPVYGNSDLPIGALTSPWTHPIECAKANDAQICVFTNSNFRNGRGISILADSKDVAEIDWTELFTEPSNPDGLIRAEGLRETFVPGKGMGLVTDHNIAKGELIMSSTPLLVEHDTAYALDPEVLGDLWDIAIERMSKAQQTLFLSQHGQWGGHRPSDIMATNSYTFKSFGGLPGGSAADFPEVSRINHACRPNVNYSFDSKTLSQSLYATRTIHPGEEITVSYINIIESRHERLHALHSGWGFKCTCSHCALPLTEIDKSDERIRRIKEIAHNCDDLWATNDMQCGLDLAIEFVLLHQEEKITGQLMASAYYRVKTVAEANGLNFLSTKYTQLTIAEQLGDGYGQAMKLKQEEANNQKVKDEHKDKGRFQEEASFGLKEDVIKQMSEDVIS